MRSQTYIVHAHRFTRRAFLASNPDQRQVAQWNKYCRPDQRVRGRQYESIAARRTTTVVDYKRDRWLGIDIDALYKIAFVHSLK